MLLIFFFFFSSRRRHTRYWRDWSSDVCSSDLGYIDYSPEQMRFLNFGRVVDTTVLREEFGYTPRYTTEQALADYAATVTPVVPPEVIAGVTSTAQDLVARIGATAGRVGERLRPSPPPPGLRAVRDA